MEAVYYCIRLVLLIKLTSSYEKCTQGISHDECYVGSCCKINNKWECRTSGLDECDSLAETDVSITEKPNTDTTGTDKATIIIPVAAGCGCLILIILSIVFAFYIRRKYREKPYVSTYQCRNTGSDAALVNNQDDLPQSPPPRIWTTRQDELTYTNGRCKRSREHGHYNVQVSNYVHDKRSRNHASRSKKSESQNHSSSRTRPGYETHKSPTNQLRSSSPTSYSSTRVKTALQDLDQEPYSRRPGRYRPERDDRRHHSRHHNVNNLSSYEKPPSYAEAMNSTEV